MNFMFESCHENLKFISSSQCVMFFLLYDWRNQFNKSKRQELWCHWTIRHSLRWHTENTPLGSWMKWRMESTSGLVPSKTLEILYIINMGYWPSVTSRWLDIDQVLFLVLMDRDRVEVHKLAKEEGGLYPAILTGKAWSIKDLLFGLRRNFSHRTWWLISSGKIAPSYPLR